VFSVRFKSSSGPSKQSFESEKPSASSASSNTARAVGYCSARRRPIPADWEPCPGKRKAVIDMDRLAPSTNVRGAFPIVAGGRVQEYVVAGHVPVLHTRFPSTQRLHNFRIRPNSGYVFFSDAHLGGNHYDGANQLTTTGGYSDGTRVLSNVYSHGTSGRHAGRQTPESGARTEVLTLRITA
jgi:hypothetical protein